MRLGERHRSLRRIQTTALVGQQSLGLAHRMGHVADAPCGARLQGQFDRIGKIEGVRAHQHRATAGTGLDQVLPPQWLETAPQQGQAGQAVIQGHFAE